MQPSYDYEGFFNDNPEEAWKQIELLKANREAHFTDKFKLPNHPTFSEESIYSDDITPGGKWEGNDEKGWTFNHSPYTAKHYIDTSNYLRDTGEGHRVDGYTEVPIGLKYRSNKFGGGGDLFGVTPEDVPVDVRAAMAGVEGAKEAYYEQQRKEANRNPHQTFKDIASFAPIVGTGIDIADAINEPNMENWLEAGVSAASDLFMLKWLKGLSSLPMYSRKSMPRGISSASKYLSPEAAQGLFIEAPVILLDQAKNTQDIKERNKESYGGRINKLDGLRGSSKIVSKNNYNEPWFA